MFKTGIWVQNHLFNFCPPSCGFCPRGRIEFCRGGRIKNRGGQNFFLHPSDPILPPLIFFLPPLKMFSAPAKINPAHATGCAYIITSWIRLLRTNGNDIRTKMSPKLIKNINQVIKNLRTDAQKSVSNFLPFSIKIRWFLDWFWGFVILLSKHI